MTYERENRFSGASSSSGVEAGYQAASNPSGINKKFIQRNLKPYKTLRKFTGKPKKLRGLKNKNYAQLERMAVRAVLGKNKVKRRKLNTRINQKRHKKWALRAARKRINQGYDIRNDALGQGGKRISSLKNKNVRKAAKHIIRVRRNRRIKKTNLYKGYGYDIKKGIR